MAEPGRRIRFGGAMIGASVAPAAEATRHLVTGWACIGFGGGGSCGVDN